MFFWFKIDSATAFNTFPDCITQNENAIFFFFQKPKSCPYHFTSIFETTIGNC